MKKLLMFLIEIVLLVGGGIGIGWVGNEIYDDSKMERELDGLWLKNYQYEDAKDMVNEKDSKGDWICVKQKKCIVEKVGK